MPQYNFEHKWAHKNTDLSHVSLDILFTLYIRNVHHARTQQHYVYVFGAQGRIQKKRFISMPVSSQDFVLLPFFALSSAQS